MNNLVFIDLENEECKGYWVGKESDDLSVIDENVVSWGEFEIEGDKFKYVKIFY